MVTAWGVGGQSVEDRLSQSQEGGSKQITPETFRGEPLEPRPRALCLWSSQSARRREGLPRPAPPRGVRETLGE